MKKKKTIRKQVILITMSVSFMSLLLISIVALFGMFQMRNNTLVTNQNLGEQAGADSKLALEAQTIRRLVEQARNKATLSDEKLKKRQTYATIIADEATDIYENPQEYQRLQVTPPDENNKGVFSAQFLMKSDISFGEIQTEAELITNLQKTLLFFPINEPSITSTYIGTESGFTCMVDENADKKPEFIDSTKRPWYLLAKEKGEPIWTDVMEDGLGRGLSIVYAIPIYDKEENLKGVIGVGSLLEDLTDIVLDTEVGTTGYALLLNEQGNVIISPHLQTDEEGQVIRESIMGSGNVQLEEVVKKIKRREAGVEQLTYEGKEVYLAFEPLETLPWSIVTIIDVEEAIAPATESQKNIIHLADDAIADIDRNMQTTLILIFVVMLIATGSTIFFSIVFSGKLTKPIGILTEGVHKISDGNLQNKIYIETGDEIEELALAFNQMTNQLVQYMSHLSKITAEKERIATELNVATEIQASMLPCIFPAFPGRKEIDIYATMLPAKEVGGDFYDFFFIDDSHICFTIADVSGKGIPAALFMVITKTLLKNNVQYGKSPKEVFETVNNQLCENNEAGMFVTAFMGILEITTGIFRYVNAGHNPPLLKGENEEFDWLLTKPGFVLAGMEDMEYYQDEMTLQKNDIIYLYTDGVTEAVNRQNELFSEQRLLNILNNDKESSIKELLFSVKEEVDFFANGAEQADDITMLAFQYK